MKDAFKFDQYVPSLDWYEVKHHTINWNDFRFFRLQRRYGPSWWLIGVKLNENSYRHEDFEIGEIGLSDLKRFIEWAKTEHGSRILSINMISSSFDIFEEVTNLANTV